MLLIRTGKFHEYPSNIFSFKPDSLQEFQTLDKATLPIGGRPSLPCSCSAKIELEWFGAKDEGKKHE